MMPGALVGRTASAADCDVPSQAVIVTFSGDGWSPELERDVRAQLAAGLAERGLAACSPGAEPGLARLELVALGPDQPITVSVDNHVTDRRVERAVDLTGFRPGARALALAVSAEELLSASWAAPDGEAPAAAPAAPIAKPVPPPALVVVAAPAPKPSRARFGLAGAAVVERYGTGQAMIGGDVDVRFGRPAGWRVAVGGAARRGVAGQVPGGETDASAWLGTGGVAVGIGTRGRFQLGAEASVAAGFATVSGRAAATGTGQSGRGPVALGRLALTGRWPFGGRSAIEGKLWGGWCAAEVRAVHDGEILGGLGSWIAGLSLGAALWP